VAAHLAATLHQPQAHAADDGDLRAAERASFVSGCEQRRPGERAAGTNFVRATVIRMDSPKGLDILPAVRRRGARSAT